VALTHPTHLSTALTHWPVIRGTRQTDEGVGTAVEFNPLNHMEFTHTVDDKKKSTFLFDRVYQPTASQADVFADCAPVVTSILDGYNVCILAYGQVRVRAREKTRERA
jgi:hypothetical protein